MIQPVRHAPQLAQWLNDRGCTVMEWDPEEDLDISDGLALDTDSLKDRGLSLADIQPGDLVFFAEKNEDREYVEQNDYKHISHVAIVTKAELRQKNRYVPYPDGWYHEIMEVISPTCALAHGAELADRQNLVDEATYCRFSGDYWYDTMRIRSLWEDPVDAEELEFNGDLAWGGTMVMVCRPNLTSANTDFGLIAEAKKLGLHEMPENWGMLNVIRRARQLTDVKWTPAVDLRRYTLKYYDGNGDPVFYDNARFKAGVEYTGVPLVTGDYDYRAVGKDCGITAFVTSMAVENTFDTSYDPDEDGVCDLASGLVGDNYELIRYAFDIPFDIPLFDGDDGSFEVPNDNNIKLCDVFNGQVIVTDIIRSGGAITYIEVCEADFGGCDNSSDINGPKGGVAVRKLMPFQEFVDKYSEWNHEQFYTGLRYNDIESVEYYPDPYVPISEPDYHPPRNLPIVPYYGNKSVQLIRKSQLPHDDPDGRVEYSNLLVPNDPEYDLLADNNPGSANLEPRVLGPITDYLNADGRIEVTSDRDIWDDDYAQLFTDSYALAEEVGEYDHFFSKWAECSTFLFPNNDEPFVDESIHYDPINKRFSFSSLDLVNWQAKSMDQAFIPHYVYRDGAYFPFIRIKKPIASYAGYNVDQVWVWVDEHELRLNRDGEEASYPLTVNVGYLRADGGATFEMQVKINDPNEPQGS